MIAPLVDTLLELSENNSDTINRLYHLMNSLRSQGNENEAMELLSILGSIMGVDFPEEAKLATKYSATQDYLLSELLADLDDILQDI